MRQGLGVRTLKKYYRTDYLLLLPTLPYPNNPNKWGRNNIFFIML
jgi:hypothetical protein